MKKLHAALLLMGVAFLGYLLWSIGMVELWRELKSLGWGLVPLVFIEGLGEMIHTLGWRRCLSGPHRALSFRRLFQIRMAGYAINYLTPTAAMGGEITRAALLSQNAPGPEAVSGVLIDKASLALAHLMFVAVGSAIILWRVSLPPALRAAMMAGGALLTTGIIAFLLLQKQGQLGAVFRWLAARNIGGSKLRQVARQVTNVDEAFRVFYRDRPLDLALSVGWHLVGFASGMLQVWLFFALLNQPVSFATVAGAWLLGLGFDLLTFAVPLNLGTLEGSRVMTFQALGFPALEGMTYGVMLRLAQLSWAAFGLAGYALSSRVLATQGREAPLAVERGLSE